MLVVTSTFPRYLEDQVPARFVLQLSEQFSNQYDVHLLAPHAPESCFRENFGKIKVYRFPYYFPTSKQVLCDGRGILPNMRSSLIGKIQIPALVCAEFFSLRQFLRKLRPDVVHSHWAIPQGLCVSHAKSIEIPQVLTIHSSDLHTLKRLLFGPQILRYVASHCHTIFLVSTYLRDLFLELVPYPSCELKILPMGVDKKFFHPKKVSHFPRFRILYVGKMMEIKGVNFLIDAIKKVKKVLPDIKLTLCGDGQDRYELEKQAKQFDPNGKIVRFKGQVSHSLLPEYLARADALIVPSIITKQKETEGMPTVILESLASGTPVLASRIGGLSDVIVEGENGLFFQSANPEDLAAKIVIFYQQKLWATMPDVARKSAGKYAWPIIGQQYIEVFNKAC